MTRGGWVEDGAVVDVNGRRVIGKAGFLYVVVYDGTDGMGNLRAGVEH